MQKEIRPFYAVTDDRYAWPPAKLAEKNSYSNMNATSYKKEKDAAVRTKVVSHQTPICASSHCHSHASFRYWSFSLQ
jgi:hypothetical protein